MNIIFASRSRFNTGNRHKRRHNINCNFLILIFGSKRHLAGFFGINTVIYPVQTAGVRKLNLAYSNILPGVCTGQFNLRRKGFMFAALQSQSIANRLAVNRQTKFINGFALNHRYRKARQLRGTALLRTDCYHLCAARFIYA